MWNGKGFMQVQVAYIGPDGGRIGKPHLGVHVGAVHVYLSAVLVNKLRNLPDRGFKYPMGGRIGDHQCSQPV